METKHNNDIVLISYRDGVQVLRLKDHSAFGEHEIA